jgi:hypothetical protein
MKTRNTLLFVAVVLLFLVSVSKINNAKVTAQDSRGYELEYFYDGIRDDCDLPCWYGLQVGNTTFWEFARFVNDLQTENVKWSFPEHESYLSISAKEVYELQDREIVNQFDLPDQGFFTGELDVAGYINNNTLEALSISFRNFTMLPIMPNIFIERLGEPSEIFIAVYEEAQYAVIWFHYKSSHMHIQYHNSVFQTDPTRICIYQNAWLYTFPVSQIVMLKTDSERLGRYAPIEDFVALQDALQTTEDEFVALLDEVDPEKACIELK